MTKQQFKAQLILNFIESEGHYPDDEYLVEIQKLADFAFNGE